MGAGALVWRPVPGYEGSYEVSHNGIVRSVDREARNRHGTTSKIRGTLLRPSRTQNGYAFVRLYRDGAPATKLVHRLVAEAFLGAPPPGAEVNHLDGNKANNHASNLQFATRSGNMSHAFRAGLQRPLRGSRNPAAKLSEEHARQVLRLKGKVTQRELAIRFGVSRAAISKIHNGANWNWLEEGNDGNVDSRRE